jgi:hypothetical protein
MTNPPDPLARDVDEVTDADAAQAAREADEAAALVDALEDRVIEGDDTITPGQITEQRELSRFARLRAAATARKAERAKRAARLRALDGIRAEMDAHGTDTGPKLAALLQAAEDATAEFCDAVNARNAKVTEWLKRMQDLDVPEHTNPLNPPDAHAGLGWESANGHVIAGSRRMRKVNAGQWVRTMLDGVAHRTGKLTVPTEQGHAITLTRMSTTDREALYAQLAAVDAPAAPPDPSLRFFRNVDTGAVWPMSNAPTGPAAKNLVEITRREAWGQ